MTVVLARPNDGLYERSAIVAEGGDGGRSPVGLCA